MHTAKSSAASATADREIVITRTFTAPRDLVWQAWTDPKHVAQWWGPRGFTTTIKQMDFRVGGIWEHVMRGPDGTNYPNKSVFKEIVPMERIVYTHGGGREQGPGASFTASWTFETLEGGRTRLTGRMVFASAAERDFVAREFRAVEGGRQTLERAAEHLAGLQSQPFVIRREYAAPLDLMWRAWTERDRFMAWFGPKGAKLTCRQFDLRPDGMTHYAMTMPDGKEIWGKAVYREIVPPTKLVWVNSFSDPEGGTTRHPLTTDLWPLQLLTIIAFAEAKGKTAITITWLPLDATDEERKVFADKLPSMNQGWGGTLEQLQAYLAGA